jgi:hypothetical protein
MKVECMDVSAGGMHNNRRAATQTFPICSDKAAQREKKIVFLLTELKGQ